MILSAFRYFPKWSIEDVADGIHYRMFDMQGWYGVWFIGGGMTWDSTKSCMEYNNLLLRQAGII